MNIPNPPLYKELREVKPIRGDGHHGLWYDRYFNQYDAQWLVYKKDETKRTEDGKREWIRLTEGLAGETQSLQDATARLATLCKSREGMFKVFVASWHFATGLGNPHPVENGFLWHPTLAAPYIPGAAVKGLVRAWMEGAWEESRDNEKLHRWFGTEDKNPTKCKKENAAGAYIFFDALPVEQVKLKADVMTPHMKDWYEKGGEEPMNPEVTPADWHSPVPVPFLVADKPKFMFAIAPRDGKENDELPEVITALEKALEWLGAGAKTGVGYGRMNDPSRLAQNWLDQTIDALKNDKDLKGQPEENLWKKALSEEYLRANSDIRKAVLPLIQKRWETLGIDWNNPTGGSAQQAKINFITGGQGVGDTA